MISAAVIPLLTGWAGLVIAEGDAAPFRCLVARSLEVGHLVELDTPRRAYGKAEKLYDKERRVTPEDISGIVGAFAEDMREHGVERVVIARPAQARGKVGALAQSIADAFTESARAARLSLEVVPRRLGDDRGRVEEGFSDWPADAGFTVTVAAAALLLRALEPEHAEAPRVVARPVIQAPKPAEGASNAPEAGEPDVARGPRTLTVDPGSHHVGVVVAEGDAVPLRCILATTIAVGHDVPLAKPKTVKGRDGTTYQRTHEHVIDANDLVVLHRALQTIARDHKVTRAVVEAVERLHLRASSVGQATVRARDIVLSERVGGAAIVSCSATGLLVLAPSVRVVRDLVAGGSNAKKPAVAAAVAAGFTDWPAASDHARDAGVLALWAVTPARPPKEPAANRARAKRDPSLPRDSNRNRNARRAAERAAVKAATGCTCVKRTRYHRHDCPCSMSKTTPADATERVVGAESSV